MIKEIKIYNRFKMEMFARNNGLNFPYKNWNLISIHCGDELVNHFVQDIFTSIGCNGILSMRFEDVTPENYKAVKLKHPDSVLFEDIHAKRIVEFIDAIQKQNDDSVLVAHCHAGISRSGAVGTFACDYCGLDYSEFLEMNPYIMANPHVLSTLRRVAGMTPSFGKVK